MIRMTTISLLAILAMSAVGATSASAFGGFLSEPGAQLVLASQTEKHKFTVEGKSVECEEAMFHGRTTALLSTLILFAPTYSKCTAFGFANSTVHVNGCDYTLHISGLVDFGCPTGKDIQVLVNNLAGCAILIKPQSNLSGITYSNTLGANGKMAILATIAVKKIAVSSNGKGIGCPSTSATEGEYTGSSVAEGGSGDLLVH